MTKWLLETVPIENVIILIGTAVLVFGIVHAMNHFENWLRRYLNF